MNLNQLASYAIQLNKLGSRDGGKIVDEILKRRIAMDEVRNWLGFDREFY